MVSGGVAASTAELSAAMVMRMSRARGPMVPSGLNVLGVPDVLKECVMTLPAHFLLINVPRQGGSKRVPS